MQPEISLSNDQRLKHLKDALTDELGDLNFADYQLDIGSLLVALRPDNSWELKHSSTGETYLYAEDGTPIYSPDTTFPNADRFLSSLTPENFISGGTAPRPIVYGN